MAKRHHTHTLNISVNYVFSSHSRPKATGWVQITLRRVLRATTSAAPMSRTSAWRTEARRSPRSFSSSLTLCARTSWTLSTRRTLSPWALSRDGVEIWQNVKSPNPWPTQHDTEDMCCESSINTTTTIVQVCQLHSYEKAKNIVLPEHLGSTYFNIAICYFI